MGGYVSSSTSTGMRESASEGPSTRIALGGSLSKRAARHRDADGE